MCQLIIGTGDLKRTRACDGLGDVRRRALYAVGDGADDWQGSRIFGSGGGRTKFGSLARQVCLVAREGLGR